MTGIESRTPARPGLRPWLVALASAVLTVAGCAVAARLETIAGVADQGGLLGPTLVPLGILPLGSGWSFRLAAGVVFGLGLVAVLRAAAGRDAGAAAVAAATSLGLALTGIVVAVCAPPLDAGVPASSWVTGLLGEVGRSSLVLAWACATALTIVVGRRSR